MRTTTYLSYDEVNRVMLTEEKKRRRKPPARVPLKQSCPQGLTESDLAELLGPDLPEFRRWMIGQTQSICDGRRYHHDRHHDDFCKKDFRPGTEWYEKAHTDDDGFSWRCGYGGGYYEPTGCADNPHGMVAYPWDVERYLMRLPVIDL